ncbi:hypothetical protein PC129_g3658 [Phytophthora cactorum]|uniref:Uncharacterized protein n=1 Tax=Phytophthora cactorum TaxID=29920 RepID=A0A8T1LW02_9STRA|nr:hypothetical protein Pcac1_g2576 [Phytophthora cactorum]KAG2841713.1 hypothetical protein PC111_g3011 [Phytophthora cactorum]KAG3105506.1 hypothetical protein PC122_g807 [Phytophthora cactorum]KAG3225731.1 hypothetical protein PC129_g3658 [Phytophthora cactorum]KAG4251471.1 hypothetical protein PC116_g811 [Phytophthora cactorum]
MITRGTSDLPRASTSPSSRANIAPSVVHDGACVTECKQASPSEAPHRNSAGGGPQGQEEVGEAHRCGLVGYALEETYGRRRKSFGVRHAGHAGVPAVEESLKGAVSGDVKIGRRVGSCEALGGFDLGAFMASFEPGVAGAGTVPAAESRTSAAAPDQDTADMAAQLYALKAEEVQQLRALVAHQAPAPARWACAVP